jgi:hypothetical protein
MFLGLRRSCPVILQKRRRKHYYLPPLTLAIDLFHSVAAWMADCWLFDLLGLIRLCRIAPGIIPSNQSLYKLEKQFG